MRAWPLLLGLLGSCGKVPIYQVNAYFSLADASWFAEEDTLFIFYEVHAEQGLGEPSVVEITYTTDDEVVDWTPVEELATVHEHVPVDCGPQALCGSTSLRVDQEPREVRVRLRYHRDGALALKARTVFNVVGEGPPHSHRSLLVDGVLDENNELVRWRARHQFPTLRNARAQSLGLRRLFTIEEQAYGTVSWDLSGNPYGYGRACPEGFVPLNHAEVYTRERAVFDLEPLPRAASEDAMVCARATVQDAHGSFATGAIARKNPEVRSAFPVLRSPILDALQVRFYLAPCDRVISQDHEDMQRQRLGLEGVPTTCIEGWSQPGFVEELAVMFREAVEEARLQGRDMVLVVGLEQDEDAAAVAVEQALALVVPQERHRTSPRLAGAFVFDSTDRGMDSPELAQSTLWCPATLFPNQLPNASAQSCPALPDIPDLDLGPFTFGALQILPSRPEYLDFIDTYSKKQAGEVTERHLLVPEFSTLTDHVDFGAYGVVSFLNGELITADADDAFSYCLQEEAQPFVVRSELMQSPDRSLLKGCTGGGVPAELCVGVEAGLLPLESLSLWHNLFAEDHYELGIFWEFPFLLRMDYEARLAGSVSAFGLSVPFGIAEPAESYYGAALWLEDDFQVDPALAQCTRFCDHPTFDSAGVYHVSDLFRSTYARQCYTPDLPAPGDSGFPLDP